MEKWIVELSIVYNSNKYILLLIKSEQINYHDDAARFFV